MKPEGLMIAIGSPKKGSMPAGKGSDSEASDYTAEKESAAKALLQAVEDQDASALRDALEMFVLACHSEYSEEDSDEDDGDTEEV
jgi:hypothetical protein